MKKTLLTAIAIAFTLGIISISIASAQCCAGKSKNPAAKQACPKAAAGDQAKSCDKAKTCDKGKDCKLKEAGKCCGKQIADCPKRSAPSLLPSESSICSLYCGTVTDPQITGSQPLGPL